MYSPSLPLCFLWYCHCMDIDLHYLINNANAWAYDAASDTFIAEYQSDDPVEVSKEVFDQRDVRIYPILKYSLSKWSSWQCARALQITLRFWADPNAFLYSNETGGDPHDASDEPRYAMCILGLLSQPDHPDKIVFDVEYSEMERLSAVGWFSTGAWRKSPQVLDRALLEFHFPGSIERLQCLLALGVSRDAVAAEVFRIEQPAAEVLLPTLVAPHSDSNKP